MRSGLLQEVHNWICPMCWCAVVVQPKGVAPPVGCSASSDALTQPSHHFQIIVCVHTSSIWHKFPVDHALGIPKDDQHDPSDIAVMHCFVRAALIAPEPGGGAAPHQRFITAKPRLISSYHACLQGWCTPESVHQVLGHVGTLILLSLGQQVQYPLGWTLVQIEAVPQSVVDGLERQACLGSDDTDACHVVLSQKVLNLLELCRGDFGDPPTEKSVTPCWNLRNQ